jgi:cyclohexadienyl dehydratase
LLWSFSWKLLLKVDVRFVRTTWGTLLDDLAVGKFDIAMGGISMTPERQKRAGLTNSYLTVGKSPLIRKEDKDRYKTLSDINQIGVKVGFDPGGTNEKFVRSTIKLATLIVVKNNLDIPEMLETGRIDAVITDNVEAILIAKTRSKLYAVSPHHAFTREVKGYMVPKNDLRFIKVVNIWINDMKLKDNFNRLAHKWICAQ